MKATISGLAALLVSVFTFNAATAQTPYPVMPVHYGHAGGHAGPVGGVTSPGGCDCGSGKLGLLGKPGGLLHKDDCGGGWKGGCNTCGNKCPLLGAIKNWLCRPFPSNAPSHQGTLGFPHHPYLRSPRDYFMYDIP